MKHCCSRNGALRVVHGSANPKLAEDACRYLNIPLTAAHVSTFANGETSVKILESIRGDDVFVIQPTCGNGKKCNVNQAVMELLLLIHTLKLSSARRVIAVIPHYGYARQDRKHTGRVPISASAVARMITEVGVNAVVTMDLHCDQIQGFFHGCSVADLNPRTEFAEYMQHKNFDMSNLVVVAPDAGAVTRARRMGDRIGASRIVTILKRRVEPNQVESMQLVGEVEGCVCVIVDDMIDTAGTLCKAAEVLHGYGAREVHAWATHGIFTDPACERITQCSAPVEVVVTDTIPQEEAQRKCSKIKVISSAKLLADAIYRLHYEESLESIDTIYTFPIVTMTCSPWRTSSRTMTGHTRRQTQLLSEQQVHTCVCANASAGVETHPRHVVRGSVCCAGLLVGAPVARTHATVCHVAVCVCGGDTGRR